MILGIIILILVTLVALYFCYKNIINALLFIFVLYNILPFMIGKLAPDLYGFTGFYIQAIIFLIFFYSFIISKSRLEVLKSPLFIIIICSVVYLIFLALYRDLDMTKYVTEYRRSINNIAVFFTISITQVKKEDISRAIKFLGIALIVNVIIGLVSYFGPEPIYDFFALDIIYEWRGREVDFSNSVEGLQRQGKLITGTFSQMNKYANLIALLITVYLFYNFSINNIKKVLFLLIVVILSIIAVSLSGIRTSLITLFIGLLLVSFYKNKLLALSITILIVFMFVISNINFKKESDKFTEYSTEFQNPIERAMGVFVLFKGIDKIKEDQESNLAMSLNLLEYFPENPFFGSGKYYKDGYGNIKDGNKNNTDVTLVLLFVEYGIIGAFIFLFPFVYVLFQVKSNCNKNDFWIIVILFILLLVQMISDHGLFFIYGNFIYFLLSGVLLQKSKNNLNSINN